MKFELLYLLILLSTLSHNIYAQPEYNSGESFHQLIEESKTLNESFPDSALVLARKALVLAERLNSDSLKAKAHIAVSASYSYLADYNSAVENSFKALGYAEPLQDTISMIDAYNNLGIDFMYQEDYQASRKYFKEVESLSMRYGDSLRWGHALNNLGLVVGYGGGNSDEEMQYYELAKPIFLAIGEREGYANVLLNIGTIYTERQEYILANRYYEEALGTFRELNYATAVEQTLQSMSENLLEQGNANQALASANEALEVALQNSIIQDLPFIYELITKIYISKSDYRQAYEYQRKHYAIQDSIFNSEKSLQIHELKTRYETEQKQHQIELLTTQYELSKLNLLKKKREQYAFIFVIIFLVVIGGLVGYVIITRARLNQQLLSQEIDNLRLKINSFVEGSAQDLDIKMEEVNEKLITPLSEREFEILMLAISDQSNGAIADKLFVSVNTVKFHLKNVYEKLGVSNRKEALQFAINTSKD